MHQGTDIEMLGENLAVEVEGLHKMNGGRVYECSGDENVRKKLKPTEDVDKIDSTWKYRAVEG